MRTPSKGARRAMLAAAVPVGMVVSGALVWQSSYAAFSASTTNPGNNWASGTVVLTDNDNSNAALFNSADDGNLAPGNSRSKCITVAYTGTLTANEIKMYVTTPVSGVTDLDPHLNITVERKVATDATADYTCATYDANAGTETTVYGSDANLTDDASAFTLAALKTADPDYANGTVVATNAANPTNIAFKISYRLKNSVTPDNSAMNKESDATFNWEVRSKPDAA